MIIVDVETTGVNPQKNSIVSIGALDFFNPTNKFYEKCIIWHDAEISPIALEINGFSREDVCVNNKNSLRSIMKKYLSWIESVEDKTIVGENPAFDFDFLKASADKYALPWIQGRRTIDLHSISYAHMLSRGIHPPTKNGVSALSADKTYSYVGLRKEPKPHNALTGAKMEGEAISRLIYGKSLLKEYEKYFIPDYLLR